MISTSSVIYDASYSVFVRSLHNENEECINIGPCARDARHQDSYAPADPRPPTLARAQPTRFEPRARLIQRLPCWLPGFSFCSPLLAVFAPESLFLSNISLIWNHLVRAQSGLKADNIYIETWWEGHVFYLAQQLSWTCLRRVVFFQFLFIDSI